VVVSEVGFEECYREHYPRLVALGVAMTGDPDRARELAQETFVRLHDNWEQIRGYDRPGAWLRRVMSNLLIDEQRSRNAERRAVRRLAGRARHPEHESPLGAEGWWELVASLPARQRLIVTLFYGEDLTVADVATELDIAPGTVKSALSKARQSLRDRWEAP
jgi:RNA polymerase sigma-70 factor, ECF subfamily